MKLMTQLIKFMKMNTFRNFLREMIYPKIQRNTFVHDEFFEKKSFPTKRKSREFVGQAFNEDDSECETKHGDMLI